MTLGTEGQCEASGKLDFDESQSDAITRSLFGISQQSLKIMLKHCQSLGMMVIGLGSMYVGALRMTPGEEEIYQLERQFNALKKKQIFEQD